MPVINSFNGGSVKDWGLIRSSVTPPIITSVTSSSRYAPYGAAKFNDYSTLSATFNFINPTNSLNNILYGFSWTSIDGSTNGLDQGAGTVDSNTTTITIPSNIFTNNPYTPSSGGSIVSFDTSSGYILNFYLENNIGRTNYSTIISFPNNSEITISGQRSIFTDYNGSWICPAGVTSVSVVCVGGGGSASSYGGGGGGGGLAYGNAIAVVPGTSYSFQVGSSVTNGNGGNTWFISSAFLQGGGGAGGVIGNQNTGGGGGGAGGYSAAGGVGGRTSAVSYAGGAGGTSTGTGRTGGGAGGAGGAGNNGNVATLAATATGGGSGAGGSGGWTGPQTGGGVGLLGTSAVDDNGVTTTAGTATVLSGGGLATNNGGSGGSSAVDMTLFGMAANYGGGNGSSTSGGGGIGGLRIIWSPPGKNITRAFPSTNVGTI